MKKITRLVAAPLVTVLALGFVGCSGDQSKVNGSTTGQNPSATSEATDPKVSKFLEDHGFDGMPVAYIIDKLEKDNTGDRENGPEGIVESGYLKLSDGQDEVSVPITDGYYLAIAPYTDNPFECTTHNLATDQGELANREMHFTLTDDGGQTLVDESLTTYDNGFIGFWLPKDKTGKVTVTSEGKTGSADFSTTKDSPTCIGNLQLS